MLEEHLRTLAARYETAAFIDGDPSWYMHQVSGAANQEIVAFIAASLSYGSRRQFMPKIALLLNDIRRQEYGSGSGAAAQWLLEGRYTDIVPDTETTFYRLYTSATYHAFLRAMAALIAEHGTLRGFLISQTPFLKHSRLTALEALEAFTGWFRSHGSRGVVPQDTRSSCKRLCMLLRWMVRDASPVDIGLWADIIPKSTLIMPLDTHVVQEARRLGLMSSAATSMASARRLTARLAEIFPGDPLRGDFALFGLGVDTAGE